MTFFADLSFSQPEKPTFRKGLQFECFSAQHAVTVVEAYIKGYYHGKEDQPCSILLEKLSLQKTRGVEYVRI